METSIPFQRKIAAVPKIIFYNSISIISSVIVINYSIIIHNNNIC